MQLLNILYSWFMCTVVTVKWGQCFSKCFILRAGVRQGGVLSPYLFGIYVDKLLQTLHSSGYGCVIKGIVCNAFMYADDLIILTASVVHLQKLLAICQNELNAIGLSLNLKKSKLLRVGKRFKVNIANICVGGIPLECCNIYIFIHHHW